MRRRADILPVIAAAYLASPGALANGVISERAAGGLVFKKTDTIAIASEDLFLSTEQVRVAYVYTSTAPAAQTVTISFPMPDIPLESGPETEVFTRDDVKDPHNYMDFSVRVDGRPIQARRAERALFKDKDVSARLKAAGVPPLFVIGGEEALKRVPEATKDQLVNEGLFFKSDTGEYTAQWTYQTLFEWEQTFRPGQTKVDIRYKPIVGDSPDYGDYYEKGEGVKRYCADEAFRNAMKRRRQAGTLGEPLTLGYVLKTARFWNGPIGRFRLVVDKGKAGNIAAFCPLGAKKVSATRFEWSATNFVPERDIDVVVFVTQ